MNTGKNTPILNNISSDERKWEIDDVISSSIYEAHKCM